MKIIDCKDINCDFLKKKLKLFNFQGYGGEILVYNKKLLVKKVKDDKEVNNIKKIIDLFSKHKFKIFIASHYRTYLYESNNL